MGLLSIEPKIFHAECMPEAYCMVSNSQSPGKDFSAMKEVFFGCISFCRKPSTSVGLQQAGRTDWKQSEPICGWGG